MSATDETPEIPETPQPRPLLRVVRGTPDELELAALTAVVAGLVANGGEPEAPPRRSLWANPAARTRRPLHPGPGAWKASALSR